MRVTLDYGTDGLEVDLPDEGTTVIEPAYPPGVDDPEETLRQALASPIDATPPREIVKAGERVAISVCDGTRPQPRALMLRALFESMPDVRPKDAVILIATGTHRANNDVELEAMLGDDIVERYRVVNHDARDGSTLASVGESSNGVPVFLNREWIEADVRITTGFVEPHFFAGFSGGPKMVAPGLAGLETTMVLHDAHHVGHPKATWGVTEGNPIHDDVRDIARMTGVDFAFDVTLNGEKEITAAFAGELFAEHRAACGTSMREAMREVRAPFDVVVTTNSGFPLDQNLYQTIKGMSAAAKVVKDGGVILCAAECRDGLPDHGAYARALEAWILTRRASRNGAHTGFRRTGSVADSSSGADSKARPGSGQDELSLGASASWRAFRAHGGRFRSRPARARGSRGRGNAVRVASRTTNDPLCSLVPEPGEPLSTRADLRYDPPYCRGWKVRRHR